MPRDPGSGSSHLGQLLAEPEVLFAEFAEGPSPLPATVLLLGTLLPKLSPKGLHVPLQLHCPGLPLGSPGCQAPAQFMVLLLQLLWGRDRDGTVRLEGMQSNRQRPGGGRGEPRGSEAGLRARNRTELGGSRQGGKTQPWTVEEAEEP